MLARHRRILKRERWCYGDKCSSAILDVETNRKLGRVPSSFTLQNTPALQVSTSLSIFPDRIGVSKCCFLKDRRKLEKAKKKLSEQGRGLTSISTHKWCRFRDSVTGRREKHLISLCFVAWFYCSLGTFSIRDGSENVSSKWIGVFSNFVAFTPIFWKCLMQANFPEVNFLGTC